MDKKQDLKEVQGAHTQLAANQSDAPLKMRVQLLKEVESKLSGWNGEGASQGRR